MELLKILRINHKKITMDLQNKEIEVIKMLREAELQGAQKERAKWESRIFEAIPEADSTDEWVTTKEAMKIVKRTSYNTLMKWVELGLINPPKKIGRPLYWEKANLLKMSPNGK